MQEREKKTDATDVRAPADWSALGSEAELMDVVTDPVFAFDGELRIMLANAAFSAEFCGGNRSAARGHTLGNVLRCRHAVDSMDCGESAACGVCGWFLAACATRRGESSNQECRVLTDTGNAFDFAVRTFPARMRGFGICSLKDTYASKRLRVLERSLFHDVLNLAVGIKGLTEMLDLNDVAQTAECIQLLHGSAAKMTDESLRLRTLREAESGCLSPCYGKVSGGELLKKVVACYQEDASARHVDVCVVMEEEVVFETDRELAHLILSSQVLNAIEASKRGDRVTVGVSEEDTAVVFCVRSAPVLAEDVRLQLFERSFTTKGAGKGVGAYGAKLIAERYLGGRLWFVSQESEGTVFYLRLPLVAPGTPVSAQ